jgi:hypothetical protein
MNITVDAWHSSKKCRRLPDVTRRVRIEEADGCALLAGPGKQEGEILFAPG